MPGGSGRALGDRSNSERILTPTECELACWAGEITESRAPNHDANREETGWTLRHSKQARSVIAAHWECMETQSPPLSTRRHLQ